MILTYQRPFDQTSSKPDLDKTNCSFLSPPNAQVSDNEDLLNRQAWQVISGNHLTNGADGRTGIAARRGNSHRDARRLAKESGAERAGL